MSFTFKKSERLCSKIALDALFKSGEGGFVFPFKYVVGEGSDGAKVVVSVGKRYHKRANKRNTIKRRTKEAYRLNKASLEGKNVNIAMIYISKQEESYKTIENATKRIISKIAEMG